jgi:hypothetical protein
MFTFEDFSFFFYKLGYHFNLTRVTEVSLFLRFKPDSNEDESA